MWEIYFAHLNAQVYIYCNKITIMYSIIFKYICCCSVAQSCLTLCDPMDCSMPGFPVHHQLPEVVQTHAHWVSDAISFSVILFSSDFPSIRVFSGELALCIRWSEASASVLPMNIQSRLTGLISLQPKALSRVFSNTTFQKNQFFASQPSLWSNSHTHTWLLEKIALTIWIFIGKVISLLFNTLLL